MYRFRHQKPCISVMFVRLDTGVHMFVPTYGSIGLGSILGGLHLRRQKGSAAARRRGKALRG